MYLSGYQNVPGAPGNLLAGLSFDINKSPGALEGRSGAGPQLPLASVGGMAPMGNAGFFLGPQYGQELQGYGGKYVS